MTNIIKFLTAGNVDDGKSTLIGRLLHDTNSLYQDQIDEVKNSTDKDFAHELDFSLFLDGLISERAQKITIDVAYRYFSYLGQKFIIADAPGHKEYTRNMAVATANSDIVIILIDAKKGIQDQTIRHSYIASLFGIKKVIVAVNKMDVIGYDQKTFTDITNSYLQKVEDFNFEKIDFVPISALLGKNITIKDDEISWYKGKAIIDYLLESNVEKLLNHKESTRFLVQNIVKHENSRYYQGLLASGELEVGDEIVSFPAHQKAKVNKIIHSNNVVNNAVSGNSIAISFDNEIDLERGSLVSSLNNLPQFSNKFNCNLIWFSSIEFNLKTNQEFLLKINHNQFRARISKITNVIDVNDILKIHQNEQNIYLNQIANVEISLSQPTAFDEFSKNKNSGSFFLINAESNETMACGIISDFLVNKENRKKPNVFYSLKNFSKNLFQNS